MLWISVDGAGVCDWVWRAEIGWQGLGLCVPAGRGSGSFGVVGAGLGGWFWLGLGWRGLCAELGVEGF